MGGEVLPPRIEGTVAVGGRRRLGFAEFGSPGGRPVMWLHGTPGARRQVPAPARALAVERDLRVVGIDRPGIGSSTPHRYESIRDFAADLDIVADRLGFDRMSIIGLSGGGPYALGAGAVLPDRVEAVGILGGVAPTRGPDAIGGGLVALGAAFAPALSIASAPIGMGLSRMLRIARPLANPALDLYARLSPEGDRALLLRPEFRAMFLDDLINGSRKQFHAPLADVMRFAREWGFDLADVKVPVRWWHGDADHIVPFAHGVHVVERLPDAELTVLPGESHLGGLDVTEDLFDALAAAARHGSRARRRRARPS
jgi:pimeloyl-ACP methyl ester carboxylesterase